MCARSRSANNANSRAGRKNCHSGPRPGKQGNSSRTNPLARLHVSLTHTELKPIIPAPCSTPRRRRMPKTGNLDLAAHQGHHATHLNCRRVPRGGVGANLGGQIWPGIVLKRTFQRTWPCNDLISSSWSSVRLPNCHPCTTRRACWLPNGALPDREGRLSGRSSSPWMWERKTKRNLAGNLTLSRGRVLLGRLQGRAGSAKNRECG